MNSYDDKQHELAVDWNNNPVKSAKSRGGVIALANPFQNLVSTGISPWPPSEIVQKLYRSTHGEAFPNAEENLVTSHLGYYCDLQSIHSEDAITWSVFGTLSRSNNEVKSKWVDSLLKSISLPQIKSNQVEITLWRRIPHPDTVVSGGPEIDVLISTENVVVLVEAKWFSKIGSKQGKGGDKNQIQLRGEYLEKLGHKFYPKAGSFVVLGLALDTGTIIDTAPDGVLFKETTWAEVCGMVEHPLYEEIQRYYYWKRKYSRK